MTTQGNSSARSPFVPVLEAMEPRRCPSAASVLVTNHTLVIHTAHAADTVVITDDGQGDVSATVSGAESASGSGSQIRLIRMIDDGGSDSITYQLTSALKKSETIDLRLRHGNDQATLDFS